MTHIQAERKSEAEHWIKLITRRIPSQVGLNEVEHPFLRQPEKEDKDMTPILPQNASHINRKVLFQDQTGTMSDNQLRKVEILEPESALSYLSCDSPDKPDVPKFTAFLLKLVLKTVVISMPISTLR